MEKFGNIIKHDFKFYPLVLRTRYVRPIGGLAISSDLFLSGLKDEIVSDSFNVVDRKTVKGHFTRESSDLPVVLGLSKDGRYDLAMRKFLSKREVSFLKYAAISYCNHAGSFSLQKVRSPSWFYAYSSKEEISPDLVIWGRFGEKIPKMLTKEFIHNMAFSDVKRHRYRKKNGVNSYYLGVRFFLADRSSCLHTMPAFSRHWVEKQPILIERFFKMYKFLLEVDVSVLSFSTVKRIYTRLFRLSKKIDKQKSYIFKFYLRSTRLKPIFLLYFSTAYMHSLLLRPFVFKLVREFLKYSSDRALVRFLPAVKGGRLDRVLNPFIGNLLRGQLDVLSARIFNLDNFFSSRKLHLLFSLIGIRNKIFGFWLSQGVLFDNFLSRDFGLRVWFLFNKALNNSFLKLDSLLVFAGPLSFNERTVVFASNAGLVRSNGFLSLFRSKILNSFILPYHWSKLGVPTLVDINFTFFSRDNYLDRIFLAHAASKQSYISRWKTAPYRRYIRSKVIKALEMRRNLFSRVINGVSKFKRLKASRRSSNLLKLSLLNIFSKGIKRYTSVYNFITLAKPFYKVVAGNRKRLLPRNKNVSIFSTSLPQRFQLRRIRRFRRRRLRIYGFRYMDRLRALKVYPLRVDVKFNSNLRQVRSSFPTTRLKKFVSLRFARLLNAKFKWWAIVASKYHRRRFVLRSISAYYYHYSMSPYYRRRNRNFRHHRGRRRNFNKGHYQPKFGKNK